ncbi:hypothetical protein OCL06_15940 [Alteromonas sp. ASW11-19]|uniref:Uncharacterized protein n=1 Tax=Alteromonas salexigens TaxID=2982530 RepID=A0ABT2VS09_9ALTE|nr:hypothetical protein [Alteromonas salexigens]MCU7556083.1 hypothetical protein [Alteromonas salexigens]
MKLLLDVSCANDMADDVPCTFYAELTDADIARIKTLAAAVKQVDAYEIKEFDYSGSWYNACCALPAIKDDPDQFITDEVSGLEGAECRVEVPMLCVTQDKFKFISVPKHCGDNFSLSTRHIDIAELDTSTAIISL